MAFARESNQHSIHPRGVETAAGINEGFQSSSVLERVSDTVRTSRDTAHKVWHDDTTGCCHSKGRDIDYTGVCNHGSNELGLGLVNSGHDNMGPYSMSQGNQNKEEPTGLPGPQIAMRGSQDPSGEDIIECIGEMEKRDVGLFAELNQEVQEVNDTVGNSYP
ncbi:hypothetical protein Ancab_015039 [Ancistrocladus abbreviatus]